MSTINYYFDNNKIERPYTMSFEANADSLPPFNALRISPEFKQGYHPCEHNGQWILIEDNRGKTVFSIENQQPLVITELGPIPEGYTKREPSSTFDDWNGQEWVENVTTKKMYLQASNQSKINDLSREATEYINTLQDAIDLGMANEGDGNNLKAWRKYRVLLSQIDVTSEDVILPEKPNS